MPKHTPGPWAITEKRLTAGATLNVWSPRDAEGSHFVVARVDAGLSHEEGGANARLIAAAPFLLEALTTILRLNTTQGVTCDEYEAAETAGFAAIAEATKEV